MKKFIAFLKTGTLVILSSIIALFVTEFLVRLIIPNDKMVTWIEMHEEGFVMNQSGGSTFQEFGERTANYHFNKERLRGNKLDSNRVNILTIGDSFTFGLLLNEEDTYVHHLQEKADSMFPDSIQFMNAAVGGSGLADWPGWLEEFGEKLQPDYLVYFMNYDDVSRALSKNLFVFDTNATDSLIPSKRWKPRKTMQKLNKKEWYKWLQAHSDLSNIIVKVLWKYAYFKDVTYNFDAERSEVPLPSLNSYDEDSDYAIHLANSILLKINAWCAQNNCELLIITTGYFETSEMSVYDGNFYEWVKNSEFQLKDAYFDNSPCVSNHVRNSLDEIRIPTDSHPNELGAKIIANCSWKIIENKLSN